MEHRQTNHPRWWSVGSLEIPRPRLLQLQPPMDRQVECQIALLSSFRRTISREQAGISTCFRSKRSTHHASRPTLRLISRHESGNRGYVDVPELRPTVLY